MNTLHESYSLNINKAVGVSKSVAEGIQIRRSLVCLYSCSLGDKSKAKAKAWL